MTCKDIYKNLSIASQNNSLNIGPCCISPTTPSNKIDFYHNKYLNKLRDQWSQNVWPLECNNCKKQEQAGMVSRRQGSNQWYADRDIADTSVELIRLDYWIGDTCNLACAICGPANSSAWKKELKISSDATPAAVNKFWKDLDLSSLRSVHFHGGEPLLSKEHIKFLQALPFKNQVEITYNTNATIRASSSLLTLWQEFQLVVLDFSIDDIEKRFEYQRYPAVWNDVVENLNWYIDNAPHNAMFNVNTTVGWLNCYSLDHLNQWLKENFYITRFGDPIQHRKQPVIGKLGTDQKLDIVKKYLDEIDYRRGTNWREVFPELVNH